MKKRNKGNGRIAIFAIIIIAIIAIIVMVVNKGKIEEKVGGTNNIDRGISVAENGGKKTISDVKKYKGLEISNINLKVDDQMTSVTADVYNPTSSKIEEQDINIRVLDSSGNIVTEFTGIIDAIESGETRQLSSAIVATAEDKNACDIEITEVAPMNNDPVQDNPIPEE